MLVDQAELAVAVAAVQRAASDGMELRVVNNLLGLFQAHQVRHHDAGGVRFERTDVVAVAALGGHTGQGVAVIDLGGTHAVFNGAPVGGHMLHINPDAVKTAHCGNLSASGIAEVQLRADGDLAVAHLAQNSAFSHMKFHGCIRSLLFKNWPPHAGNPGYTCRDYTTSPPKNEYVLLMYLYNFVLSPQPCSSDTA